MNRYLFFALVATGIAFRVLMILAPELINGSSFDAKIDVFATGIILYSII